jgi:Domain of unknown function (DUF4440)
MMVVAAMAASMALSAQTGSLEAASEAFDNAQLHHDRAAIESFLAPDFQYVTRHGALLGRKEFIDATSDPNETLEPFEVFQHRVLPLGADGGIASADTIVRGTQAGKPFVDRFRFADVFARRDGRWVVVYVQVTALPAPAK